MIEFSEQDIARIEKIVFEYGTLNDNSRNQAIYRAGMAAMAERAAQVALEQRCERDTPWDTACVAIAAAIRALLT